ncbi:MAG: response regulator, partial [Myxococcota bacterium]
MWLLNRALENSDVALKPYPGPKGSGLNSDRKKLLYVEDDDSVWEVTEFALRKDYQLERAKNATEAFHSLRTKSYDLILMDIELQGSQLNGIEICQVLKGQLKVDEPAFRAPVDISETPVVFVTAYATRYSREELIKAGGDDRITKPIDFTR